MEVHSSHALEITWISASWKSLKGTLNFRRYVFLLLWEFAIAMFWELYNLTGEISPNPWVGKIFVFPWIDICICIYFPLTKKNTPKFPQQPTAWEWYGFPQNISVLWKLVYSQALGIAWVPTNSKSVRLSRTWELPVLSHTFSVIWDFTHPMFCELHGPLLHANY